jgi:hypothetical protein
MSYEGRELYVSANGDRWYLVREFESGRVFVRHVANVPSGGTTTDVDLRDFLSDGNRGPEHKALRALIGTLVEERPPGREASLWEDLSVSWT